MKICIVRLTYLCISLVYYNYYICVYWASVYHYCFSNILQQIKTVNKMWWYKLLFTFLPFTTMFLSKIYFFMKKVKPKMLILVIWLTLYSSFFFVFIYKCFSSVCFIFSSMFSVPLPLTKKIMILSKYHLIWH